MLQLYEEEAIQNIANAIRQGSYIENQMSVLDMPNYIDNISSLGIDIVPSHLNDGNWVCPPEYEDISGIELDDDREEVYLSLYNGNRGVWHLGLNVTASKGYKVELGHVVNNVFIASDTYLKNNNAYFEMLLPENEQTMVARVTSQNILYPITEFRFGRISTGISGKALTISPYFQPVVDRRGRLPYVTNLSNNGSGNSYGATYLEHDSLKTGYRACVTSLAQAWAYCYNLQQLEINDWDTKQWKVTSLSNTWQDCRSLEKLDLSNWDTSNWVVTTMANLFSRCIYLKDFIQNWDTTNWAVTTIGYLFQYCYSIENLDISNWNTTNWKVISIAGIFQYCINLKKLKQNWNTINWTPTSISSIFNKCHQLKEIDLSNWNTTNWAITSTSGLFSECFNLRKIDLSNWDTHNWPCTNLNNMFSMCFNLKYVNLSGWDTSNFALVTGGSFAIFNKQCYALEEIDMEGWDFSKCKKLDLLNGLFAQCYSLKKLNVKNWIFGDIQLNTIQELFLNCYSLEEIDLSTWDTSNWKITTITNMCSNCKSLKKIKLPWDTSGWPMTGSMEGAFKSCHNLQELDLSMWNGQNFKPTSMRYFIDDCHKLEKVNLSTINDTSTTYPMAYINTLFCLKEYYPPIKSNKIAINLNGNTSDLSKESIIRVLEGLPNVSSATTITLGNLRMKLTPAEIAIATTKGWTVA